MNDKFWKWADKKRVPRRAQVVQTPRDPFYKLSEQHVLSWKTNRPTEGRVSTDRSVEAALLNTTPWPVTKSSANDFAP